MNNKEAIFIIDMQNDFCQPNGSLYVEGSQDDVTNTVNFIKRKNIDTAFISMDSHTEKQIFHPKYWENKLGLNPNTFTVINDNFYIDYFCSNIDDKEYAAKTFKKLKDGIMVWPEHCIVNTNGHKLVDQINDILFKFNTVEFLFKGMNKHDEMFGIFKYNTDDKLTQNLHVFNNINMFDKIYFVGEASSHCVKSSIEQFVSYARDLPKFNLSNIYVLEDCMSCIKGYENVYSDFKNEMLSYGINFVKSTDIVN